MTLMSGSSTPAEELDAICASQRCTPASACSSLRRSVLRGSLQCGDVSGNDLIGNDSGISVKIGSGSRVASNRIESGDSGLRVDGSGLVEDNEVRGAQGRGIVVPKNATLTLTGNTTCDNGEDLFLPDGATSVIDHDARRSGMRLWLAPEWMATGHDRAPTMVWSTVDRPGLGLPG